MDSFSITLVFIVLCGVFGAFIKGRIKDGCLRDFSGYPAVLELQDGVVIEGILRVDHTSLELVSDAIQTACGNDVNSYILYKGEFNQIKKIIRDVEKLPDTFKEKRNKKIKRLSSPTLLSIAIRKLRNIASTVRDSLLDVVGLFLGKVKNKPMVGSMLKGQGEYTSAMEKQTVDFIGTSYESILEKYIGKNVVVIFEDGEKEIEYKGILKEYTAEYIEIVEVMDENIKKDLILPRKSSVVRHGMC